MKRNKSELPPAMSRSKADLLRRVKAGFVYNVLRLAYHTGRIVPGRWYCINSLVHPKSLTFASVLQCPFDQLQELWPTMKRLM